MRLDPKYFNLFIGICAALTLIVIIYGTINYSQKQAREFRENIAEVRFDTLSFDQYELTEKLNVDELQGRPVIIQFWSTWSGKSMAVNSFLNEYSKENPDLIILAAVVRDGDELVMDYVDEFSYPFTYVRGTAFFQELLIPGVPSQILIDRSTNLYTTLVGDDTVALREELDRLLSDE
jgi:thiol-disulfide isomerase/thioredoxin